MTTERLPDPARLQSFPLSVWFVKEGTSAYIKTISDDYKGIFAHYKKPSEYCPGAVCNCPLKRLRRMWLGYASIERWDAQAKLWVPAVLQITESLEHDFRDVFRRGQVWEVGRKKGDEKKKRYGVTGKLLEVLDPAQVPPHFPFLPTLQRVYHVSHFDEWQPNPVPKPTCVQMYKSAPPVPEQSAKPELPATPEQHQALRDRIRGFARVPSTNGNHAEKGANGQ